MTTLLDVENLTVCFGDGAEARTAVRGLSFAVQEGEALGLVGESGSGKSVTALAILGLLDPAARVEGSIRFREKHLRSLVSEEVRALRGRQIGMIFQEPMTSLNPVMSVGRQIAEALEVYEPSLSTREVKRRVIEALSAVALPDPECRYNDYPHQFSGGQRQRILIAMALINRPALLIADEPTTALDVTVQAQILDLLADLRSRYNLATLFISHDLAVVSQIADRVVVMRQGISLEIGSCRQIFSEPAHPYTKSLLGAIPTMSTRRDLPLAMLDKMPDPSKGEMREVENGHWVRL